MMFYTCVYHADDDQHPCACTVRSQSHEQFVDYSAKRFANDSVDRLKVEHEPLRTTLICFNCAFCSQ